MRRSEFFRRLLTISREQKRYGMLDTAGIVHKAVEQGIIKEEPPPSHPIRFALSNAVRAIDMAEPMPMLIALEQAAEELVEYERAMEEPPTVG